MNTRRKTPTVRRRAIVVTALLAALGAPPASAHNAGHVLTPDGTCQDVGSGRPAPVVAEPAPGNLTTGADAGRLDLIPGSGDQYGARYAATRGNSRVLPGWCPA